MNTIALVLRLANTRVCSDTAFLFVPVYSLLANRPNLQSYPNLHRQAINGHRSQQPMVLHLTRKLFSKIQFMYFTITQ